MRVFQISSPRVWLLFSFLWAVTALPVAQAVEVKDLYVAEVLVTGEGDAQLRSGARAGLLQVLTRVSGRADVGDYAPVRNALRNPAAYYYQFSYETTEQQLLLGETVQQARTLRLNFEPSAIARLLRGAGLPIWGSNRPSSMFWIVVSDGVNRQILAEADEHPLLVGIRDQAKQRGVPLVFPIMDIVDSGQINAAEVWGEFFDRIRNASVRYSPDVLVTARIQQEAGGRWSGRWSFTPEGMAAGSWQSVETLAQSSDQLVRNMVDQLANELAARYAVGSTRGKIRLVVEDVKNVADYAALSAYLEQLTPVVGSSVVLLHEDVAEFELETEGQLDQLIEIIELDERLLLLGESDDRLLYRWVE